MSAITGARPAAARRTLAEVPMPASRTMGTATDRGRRFRLPAPVRRRHRNRALESGSVHSNPARRERPCDNQACQTGIYTYKEADFIPKDPRLRDRCLPPGARRALRAGIPTTLPHEEIIHKLEDAAKSFHVLIIKTKGTLALHLGVFRAARGLLGRPCQQRLRRTMPRRMRPSRILTAIAIFLAGFAVRATQLARMFGRHGLGGDSPRWLFTSLRRRSQCRQVARDHRGIRRPFF